MRIVYSIENVSLLLTLFGLLRATLIAGLVNGAGSVGTVIQGPIIGLVNFLLNTQSTHYYYSYWQLLFHSWRSDLDGWAYFC